MATITPTGKIDMDSHTEIVASEVTEEHSPATPLGEARRGRDRSVRLNNVSITCARRQPTFV